MSEKAQIYLAATVGGTVGGLVPTVFGVSAFSAWNIIGSFIGGALGIWLAWRYLHG